MKKFTVLIILAFVTQFTYAQENKSQNNEIKTIFSKQKGNGGYGAVSFGYSQIDGKDALVSGARGGYVIDHALTVGLAGYGFVSDFNYREIIEGNPVNLNLAGGYGGIFLEPVVASRFPVHVSFPVLFGIGGVSLNENPVWNDYYYYDSYDSESDVFLVLEPAAELELNLTRFLRAAAYASYRFTTDIALSQTRPDALESWTVGITFKIGKF